VRRLRRAASDPASLRGRFTLMSHHTREKQKSVLLERAAVAARGRATIPPLRQPPVGMTQCLRPAILLSSRPKWSMGSS